MLKITPSKKQELKDYYSFLFFNLDFFSLGLYLEISSILEQLYFFKIKDSIIKKHVAIALSARKRLYLLVVFILYRN